MIIEQCEYSPNPGGVSEVMSSLRDLRILRSNSIILSSLRDYYLHKVS